MPDLRSSEDALRQTLRTIEPHASFVEAVGQTASGTQLRIDRSGAEVGVEPILDGAAIRAWAGDHWIEVASSGFERAALTAAADSLISQLRHASSHAPPPGTSATGSRDAVHPPSHSVAEMSVDERLAQVRRWRETALAVDGIKEATGVLYSQIDARLYVNTVGGRRYQEVERTLAAIAPVAIEAGRVEYDALQRGGVGGQELLTAFDDDAVRACAASAVALLKSKAPPAGPMTVVLNPSVTGTLAHESFGHGTEADQFVRDRSYLKPILGSRVGPDFLSIVDDGSLPGGWGSIYFDDEGTPSRPNYLIQNGQFVGVLHDRVSASLLGGTPTGNARRSDFLSRQWVRMTNTYVQPGDWTREELLEEARDGVLLERFTSGIEDPLGGLMQIKVRKGRRIEHGRETELYSSMALSGRVLDVLGSVRAISKVDALVMDTGFCGKGHGDYIPAGSGGAYLLTQAVVGPA